MLTTLKQTVEFVCKAIALVGGFLILVIGILLFVEVVMRTAGSPTEWISEWSVYLFSWAILLGGAYTLQQGRHVRVELLMMHLPPVWSNLLDCLTSIIGAALCALIAQHGWEHLQDVIMTGETSSTSLRVPLWLTDFPLFLGFLLLSLQFLLLSVDRILAISLLKRFGRDKIDSPGPEQEAGN